MPDDTAVRRIVEAIVRRWLGRMRDEGHADKDSYAAVLAEQTADPQVSCTDMLDRAAKRLNRERN